MRKKSLFMGLFVIVALSFSNNVWATIECCCSPLTCTFTPWFGQDVPVIGIPPKDVPINDCYYFSDEQSWMCEERLICISEIEAEIPFWFAAYKPGEIIVDGICDINLVDDCESEALLGADHPGLDVLRQFRDEVLSKSEKGRRFIEAYYKYRNELVDVFERNPGLEVFAIELLERTIELLQDGLYSEEELSDDVIADDIQVLAEELDMIVEDPGLKNILNQVKQDVNNGTVLK